MADIKVLYANANNFYEEHSEANDSIKLFSLKTATKELTDAKLAKLIDGADAANEHTHDGRYYQETEHISITTGASDAAKPVITNAAGNLNDLINKAALVADLPHDDLDGVAESTAHTAFPLLVGGRDFTAVQKYATLVSITDDKALAHKRYVDEAIASAELGNEWLESALTRAVTPPGTPATGDRVLIDAALGTATGAFLGKEDNIAQWDGSAWIFTVPTVGSFISVDNENTKLYYFGGASWVAKAFESTTASTGLVKVGMDVQIDPSAAGAGLGFTSGVLAVNVDGSSLEINADTLRVKAAGITQSMLKLGLGADEISAADMLIADANSLITATEVEGALQELAFAQLGELYTTGEALNKGDVVYLSANNIISKVSSLTANVQPIGVVVAAYASGVPARAKHSRGLMTGVLTGATVGLPVYWTGSGFSQVAPSVSGQLVIQVGIAKNATDFVIDVKVVKKNA